MSARIALVPTAEESGVKVAVDAVLPDGTTVNMGLETATPFRFQLKLNVSLGLASLASAARVKGDAPTPIVVPTELGD
jgi:hypothetical protein